MTHNTNTNYYEITIRFTGDEEKNLAILQELCGSEELIDDSCGNTNEGGELQYEYFLDNLTKSQAYELAKKIRDKRFEWVDDILWGDPEGKRYYLPKI